MTNYRPNTLVLQITNRCNADCSFCGIEKENQSDLSEDTIMKCIDQADEVGYSGVEFTGGEVLLRYDDVKRYASNVTSKGMKCGFITNAYIANTREKGYKLAEELKGVHLEGICISFDADHQKYVPYENVLNTVKGALAKDLDVSLRTTHRIDTVENNINMLGKLATEVGGEFHMGNLKEDDDSKITVNGKIIKVEENCIELAGRAKNLDKDNFLPKRSINNDKWCSCFPADSLVKSNGNFLPCCSFYTGSNDFYVMGNVKDTDLRTLLRRTNDSAIDLVMSPYGLLRIGYVLEKSENPKIRKMKNKRYVAKCEFCSNVFSEQETRDFVVDEFNKFRGTEPTVVFKEREMAKLHNATVIAGNKEIKLTEYLGPLSIKDFFTSAYGHDLKIIEENEKRGKNLARLKKETQEGLDIFRNMKKASY